VTGLPPQETHRVYKLPSLSVSVFISSWRKMEERIESMSWFTYNCIPRTDKNWKKVWDSVSGQQQVIAGMLESGADFVGTQEAAAVAWALPPTGVPSGRNYPEQPINLEEAGGEAGWGWVSCRHVASNGG
jgi:hypothetical protein